MEKKKTVLLLTPHQMNKNGVAWELLHIAKDRTATIYKKEPVSTQTVRNSFPKLPDTFGSTLNRFSIKKMEETRLEIMAAGKKMGHEQITDSWFVQAFERRLHQEFTTLRPLLPMVQCYHNTISPEDRNRVKTAPCSFSSYTPGLRFQVRRQDDHYYMDAEVELNGSYFPLQSFTRTSFLLEHRHEYFILRYTDHKTISWLEQLDWKKEGSDLHHFSEHIIAHLEKDYPVVRNALVEANEITSALTGQVMLSEVSNQFLVFTPQFDYDGFVTEGAFQDSTIFHREGNEYIVTRDKTAEHTVINQVEALHANFSKQLNGYFYLSFDEAKKKSWFLKAFRKLLDLNIQVKGMDMLQHFRYCADKPTTTVKVLKEEGNRIEVSFTLFFGKEEVAFTELQKVVRAGQQAIPLTDTSIALLEEEWLQQYSIIVKHMVSEKGKLFLPKWLAISLDQSTEGGTMLHTTVKQEWWNKWQRWQTDSNAMYTVPQTVHATLRVYQQKGFEWLMLMEEIGAGMFLADDMGLGKTLQTICFIASVIAKDVSKKALIVCPASLMYNWKNEFDKFAPTFTHCVYHGASRDKKVFEDDSVQIIISSYGTLRSDAGFFANTTFSVMILDESHTIKNPASQITRLVHTIPADRRVTLSGTPVMNNTFDLYSQLQFILPGMFGSQQFFKREYADPIDRDRNEQRISDLHKLTSPFILRRTKEQVAKDLPPKTEMILWCQMDDAQQQVYNAIRDQVKGTLNKTISEQGLQKSKLQVLQGILKLRQVCNSPVLLNDSEHTCTESIKTEELLEEIENNLSNHKALVFSQFTTMLDILAKELDQKKIPYLLLTGATPAKERDRMVQEFNTADTPYRVFLLSLKAGNAGLNLTAADYVFLFDPWWNSAVEQQAIDRTHRIGQTKSVFAYKMICRDSIEERIMQLQERKKSLAGSLISEEEGFVKNLSDEDVEFLLG